MNAELKQQILDILADNNILTLATNREDGWPQATTVGYVNDGLHIYVATFPASQKVQNIRRDPRVSLTVDRDYADWNRIKGLSMGATAEVVSDPEVMGTIEALMTRKFPQLAQMPMPAPSELTFLRLRPRVISVLDYEQGFGHTELVEL